MHRDEAVSPSGAPHDHHRHSVPYRPEDDSTPRPIGLPSAPVWGRSHGADLFDGAADELETEGTLSPETSRRLFRAGVRTFSVEMLREHAKMIRMTSRRTRTGTTTWRPSTWTAARTRTRSRAPRCQSRRRTTRTASKDGPSEPGGDPEPSARLLPGARSEVNGSTPRELIARTALYWRRRSCRPRRRWWGRFTEAVAR